MKFSRRQFIATSLAAGGLLVGARHSGWFGGRKIPGAVVGASASSGHRLRQGEFPPPTRVEQKDIVIVGGGIAGLSAGYTLARAGYKNFQLLELESAAGGNSCSGENSVSAYPWGAHYVPLLTQEAKVARRLFEDFGIIKGYAPDGLPIYDEFFLCADPHERLYMRGRWQDGMVPATGISAEVETEYKRFFSLMESYRQSRGRDGRRAFAIPVAESSRDPRWLALDQSTMQEWLRQQQLVSEELHWYVNYCCRDDFGTTYDETSAWAGIHYFASRNGKAANAPSSAVVTWPEGNGWLARRLAAPIQPQLHTQALVYRVQDHGAGVAVDYVDLHSNQSMRVEARAAILAVPRFVACRLVQSRHFAPSQQGFSYAPWAVANITLNTLPGGREAPLSWDNVVYRSKLLGYVVATHQLPLMHPTRTVLTYYWPLSDLSPEDSRKSALERSYAEWQEIFLQELLAVHPELQGQVERLDVWLWGHAMVRPTRGFLWGEERRAALQQYPPYFMAHSDMSGMSIFEEACTHGTNAAEQVMRWL